MENAVILHGKPTRERYENPLEAKPHEANWLPWLAAQLEDNGIQTAVPALPEPYYPVYENWKTAFEEHSADDKTALIGHSAGAEFILRWLSETKTEVKHVVLVAPYHDFTRKYEDFSEYKLDSLLAERVGRLTIFNSLDDDVPILHNVERLTGLVRNVNLKNFEDKGHFRIGHNMTNEEFPELLDELMAA